MLKKNFHAKAYYPNPSSRENGTSEAAQALATDSLIEPEVKIVFLKETAEPHRSGAGICRKWVLLPCCCCLIITAIVFALVFGVGGTYFTSSTDDGEIISNSSSSSGKFIDSTTSKLPSSSIATTIPTTALLPPTTTTKPFHQKQNKVHGNLNFFSSNQTSFVISPFGMDYILSFIGNVGGAKEKAAINEYFGTTPISDTYFYLNALKNVLFKKNDGFILSNFVTGNEGDFMMEKSTFDNVSIYPASDLSYSHYFNDMFRKRLNNNDKATKFFSPDHFTTPEKTVVGFTFIKFGLVFKFARAPHVHEKLKIFHGIKEDKMVTLVGIVSKSADFENYHLHAISFQNKDFEMFIVENYKDNSIPVVNPDKILKGLKSLKASNISEKTIEVPLIRQQTTIDVAPYFTDILNQTLAIYSPFNATHIGKDKYDLNKFYQALRFDLSVEGVNRDPSKPIQQWVSFGRHAINNPFLYGVVFRNEVFIYFGLYA